MPSLWEALMEDDSAKRSEMVRAAVREENERRREFTKDVMRAMALMRGIPPDEFEKAHARGFKPELGEGE